MVDGIQNVGQNGVLFKGHSSFGDTFQSDIEEGFFNFCFVILVGDIDRLEGLAHDVRNDFVLVVLFHLLSLFQDGFSSFMDVVLKCDLFVDHELK